jgi:hypothetical protein
LIINDELEPEEELAEAEVEPSIDPKALIRDGLSMIKDQMDKIKKNIQGDGELNARDANKLGNYIKLAVTIAKDIKDLGDLSDDELARMSKEEIIALALEAAQKMGLTSLQKKE